MLPGYVSGSKYSCVKMGCGSPLLERRDASIELWRASSNRADFSCPAYEFPIICGSRERGREKRSMRKWIQSWFFSSQVIDYFLCANSKLNREPKSKKQQISEENVLMFQINTNQILFLLKTANQLPPGATSLNISEPIWVYASSCTSLKCRMNLQAQISSQTWSMTHVLYFRTL